MGTMAPSAMHQQPGAQLSCQIILAILANMTIDYQYDPSKSTTHSFEMASNRPKNVSQRLLRSASLAQIQFRNLKIKALVGDQSTTRPRGFHRDENGMKMGPTCFWYMK